MKKKIGISIAVVIVLLIASVYGIYRYNFPYGRDHRCDKGLWFALREYAEKHDGNFPSGGATPEASLSLIQSLPDYVECAYLLRRDVSEEIVRHKMKGGQLLDPDTCGWNYVEGLRLDSNPHLALFWDKEGLSEIGMRLSRGGHFVSFVGHPYEYIPASEWNSFLDEQKQLLEKEKLKINDKKASVKKKIIDDVMGYEY